MMTERILTIGSHKYTQVKSTDEKSNGGAHHDYEISCLQDLNGTCATVKFQKGPIKENGVNGCFIEDLMAICIDRLQCFQQAGFACRANALALTKLEESMMWLNKRTADRAARGVEGTSVK